MAKQKIALITKMGMVAGMYVALCYAFAFMSYNGDLLQFRIAEILIVLTLYNKKYCIPVILGTFIANQLMFGWIDMVIGTFATVLVLSVIILAKNKRVQKIIAAPAAAIINGVIIGLMLYYIVGIPVPLWVLIANVAIGEFAVVLFGVLAFSGLEKANPKFIDMLKE